MKINSADGYQRTRAPSKAENHNNWPIDDYNLVGQFQ